MRVGILTSTRGGSPLVYALQRVMGWSDGWKGADLCIVVNQTAHTTDYVYPEFPPREVPIAFLDTAEYGVRGRPRHAFDTVALEHDTKNRQQQERLRNALAGRSFPYFLREMWSDLWYPSEFHPIDYPLHPGSECHRKPDRDEYLARSVPVACLWGLSNQIREHITDRVRAVPGSDVYVIERDGPRLPQREYFRRLEAARCTVSADGYGSGSFRMTEALVRTALVRVPLRIRTRAPLLHGETCLDYGPLPIDPELGWNVYRAGYEHCMEHYTPEATARYIVETCERHVWNRETIL